MRAKVPGDTPPSKASHRRSPHCMGAGRMFGHGRGHALLTQGWHGSRVLTLSAPC
jgi:hypothetical protein